MHNTGANTVNEALVLAAPPNTVRGQKMHTRAETGAFVSHAPQCKRCGEAFIPEAYASWDYCSALCMQYMAAGYAKPYGACRVCGNGLSKAVAKAGLEYCSAGCRARRFDPRFRSTKPKS